MLLSALTGVEGLFFGNWHWLEGTNKLFGETIRGDGDQFGHSVAIYEDTLVVGAYEASAQGDGSGAVYVFRKDPDDDLVWIKDSRLLAPDGGRGDNFGWSVAIQENLIIVGAQKQSPSEGEREQGAVYVFDATSLALIEKIEAPDAGAGDFFGFSLGLDLPVLAVGVPFDNNGIVDKGGSVYTYFFNGASFDYTEKLVTTEDTAVDDYFGFQVAVSNKTLVATAPGDDDIGSAYVYVTEDFMTWTQQTRFTSRHARRGDDFGRAVALEGDLIVVGAEQNIALPSLIVSIIPQFLTDIFNLFVENLGIAYVFTREDGEWTEAHHIRPHVGFYNQAFARSVAIKDQTLYIGCPSATRFIDNRVLGGVVYVYSPLGPRLRHWAKTAHLSPADLQNFDDFGHSIAAYNGTLVVGSRQEDQQGEDAGAAYTFFNDDLIIGSEA